MQDSDPVVLFATAQLSSNSGATPNAIALSNPHGLPMEISEIRFSLYPLGTPSNHTFTQLPGSAIGVGMMLGSVQIVDNNVPLSTFAGMARGEAINRVIVSNSGSPGNPTEYVYWWRPKYPIFVPAGATLVPTFTNLGQSHLNVQVNVMYSARVYGNPNYKPRRQMMPWVGSYNSASFDVLNPTTASTDESTEVDLVNPFNVPLEVERIVGRRAMLGLSTNIAGLTDTVVTENENPAQAYNQTTVIIKSSRGDDITRDPTLFGTLFTDSVGEWNLGGGWSMQPSEYYKVYLAHAAFEAIGGNEDRVIGRVQFFVTLTGYREIP